MHVNADRFWASMPQIADFAHLFGDRLLVGYPTDTAPIKQALS